MTVLLACRIEAGAFSGEKVFHLATSECEDYSGIAPCHYCLDGDRQPLGRDQPPRGTSIGGFVEAFQIEKGRDTTTVELPLGDVVTVSNSLVIERSE